MVGLLHTGPSRRPKGDLTNAVIRTELTGVQFGIYTDAETKARSVVQITSPQAYDAIGTALPSGVYDPRLGPVDSRGGACITCSLPYLHCPGHFGHIELCVPVYHPLLFPRLVSFLRLKCLNCHEFRLSRRMCKTFQAQLHLVNCGKVIEALELHDMLSHVAHRAGIEHGLAGSATVTSRGGASTANTAAKRNEAEAAAAATIDEILTQKLATPLPPGGPKLTSHERSVRRQIIKDFTAACNGLKRCENCRAVSPKIRQDSANKIFQVPLEKAHIKSNAAERIKILSALDIEQIGNGGGAGAARASGYDSDASDMEGAAQDSDDDGDGDAMDVDVNNNGDGGVASLFDDEAEEVDEDDNDAVGGYKKRDASVKKLGDASANKDNKRAADKYLHPLEVEAQARLTWQLQPRLCAMVFGSAHCNEADGGVTGYGMYFMRNVAVPPSRFRPPMVLGTMTVEHAQNVYLNKIVELNDRVRSFIALVQSVPDEVDGLSAAERAKHVAEKERAESRAFSNWINLQTQVNCFMDSSKDPSASSAALAANIPPGIRQLLEKKEGIFRKHMMGKRVNFACRSVISPDPYIGTNEIGLPFYFAKTLTYPTPVTERNVEEMRELVTRGPHNYPGAVWVEFPDGRRVDLSKMGDNNRKAIASRLLPKVGLVTVGRQLRNGDMVLMNRQPTLHKPGIMAHYVRVLYSRTQNTLRMHYANCNTYNADYDGDEMNCHFPQSDNARAECEFIANTDLQYIVPTDGSPLRGLIQDHVDAGVKMTGKDTFLERWEYQQLIFASLTSLSGLEIIESNMDIELLPPAIRKPRELWTGKQVISTLLHHLRRGKDKFDVNDIDVLPGVSCERKTKTPPTAFGAEMEEHLVLVRDGELLRGVLDKAAFGATDFSLVHAVYEAYGPNKAGLLLNAFGRLFTAYLQYYSGHSCRMEDLVLTTEADQERRKLVEKAYNIGSRAAKAWADSDGGKVEIPPVESLPSATKPLKPVEAATTAAKIGELLSGEEGKENSAALDGYMQSQINPLASKIIKACLPSGLAVPFPANTFSLMVTTGAKGSMVNQSQVSCALGQQALEGRRVPRMSSGKTLPSFMPYDPNPRADGFIADRFLTGVRPQEYYFHCMAGREGLVDTAVKTSRSGYLQRCLVKHLEELKVSYDNTVRDGEGSVIQFLYGEDGIDPTKAPHLECSSSTFQYIARNHKSLQRKYTGLPHSTIDIASSDRQRSKEVDEGSKSPSDLLKVGGFVKARKLRVGTEWKRGALCRGWFDAVITKVHSSEKYYDIKYLKDQRKVSRVPAQVNFDYAGGRKTRAASTNCTILVPSAPDPIIFDVTRDQGKHRIGSSGACVSERVAGATTDALKNDKKLQKAITSSGISNDDFGCLIAKKYGSALCAPGEAVGCIAAQSIGEPSTQMTLNTFHLAGAGANVTLGIPRLREIIMTASKELKTPTMSVPLDPSVSDREATNLTRYLTKLTLMELIASKDGIAVTETLQQAGNGTWERAYHVRLKFHSKGRIADAFGLTLEDIAVAVAGKFIPKLSTTMKLEMRRASPDGSSQSVAGGEKTTFVKPQQQQKAGSSNAMTPDDEDANQGDEYDDEVADEEDGVKGSYGHREEMVSYGDMDDEEKEMEQSPGDDDIDDNRVAPTATVTDDEGDYQSALAVDSVKIDHKANSISMPPLRVDPAVQPLLMVGLVERAATSTVVRARPKINEAYINTEEDGRGRCLQTAGVNFEEMWILNNVDHNRLLSNDIWAIKCAYGVEAARMSIVDQIRGVFAVYGIEVDPRHLSLIADYMTFDGGYKAMNRIGMTDCSSPFLQMSFETTANFMVEAAVHGEKEPAMSPSANIVIGRPIRHGTGAFECLVK